MTNKIVTKKRTTRVSDKVESVYNNLHAEEILMTKDFFLKLNEVMDQFEGEINAYETKDEFYKKYLEAPEDFDCEGKYGCEGDLHDDSLELQHLHYMMDSKIFLVDSIGEIGKISILDDGELIIDMCGSYIDNSMTNRDLFCTKLNVTLNIK